MTGEFPLDAPIERIRRHLVGLRPTFGRPRHLPSSLTLANALPRLKRSPKLNHCLI